MKNVAQFVVFGALTLAASHAAAGACPQGNPWEVDGKGNAVEALTSVALSPLNAAKPSPEVQLVVCNCTAGAPGTYVIVRTRTGSSGQTPANLYTGSCSVVIGNAIDISNQNKEAASGVFTGLK